MRRRRIDVDRTLFWRHVPSENAVKRVETRLIYIDRTQSVYTVVPTNSDSDVIFCLRLLSKTLNCTLYLS